MADGSLRDVIETIAKALVDNSEEVSVKEIDGEATVVLELRVSPQDLGKVIGKQGRTARAMRTILRGAGMKLKKRFVLEILE
ncbi:MAG: KH domain-containing protein [Acidobacteriota bacterium]